MTLNIANHVFYILIGLPGMKLLKRRFDFVKEVITFLNKHNFKRLYFNSEKNEHFNIEIKSANTREF